MRASTPWPASFLSSRTAGAQVYLAEEGRWLAAFFIDDPLRPEAADVVHALAARGLRVHLVSGDAPRVVGTLARRLGIESWTGGATPQDKLDYVSRLQSEGRVVAMVGDGLNDAPVLARADVSVAMGAGADAAQLQADVVLTADRLGALEDLLAISRRAMRLVRQNLGWALAYNALALPAAALGWIGPWEAAIGMSASSFVVVLNALRPLSKDGIWKKASTSSSPSRSLSYS
jgi:P-type Cu2+ transporter